MRILVATRVLSAVVSSAGSALAEKFNGDLGGNFLDGSLNFLGGIGQPVRVNVYSYPTSRTAHVFARLQLPYGLFEFVAAFRALKSDHMGVNADHRGMPSVQTLLSSIPPLHRITDARCSRLKILPPDMAGFLMI
jgi:hypothetical protein